MCIRDRGEARWAILLSGDEMRLYRKGGSVARQYLQVNFAPLFDADRDEAVSYTHLRAHETVLDLVCRLLLEKKKNTNTTSHHIAHITNSQQIRYA